MFKAFVNSAKKASPKKVLLLGVLFIVLRIVLLNVAIEFSGSDLSYIKTGGKDTTLGFYRILAWIFLAPLCVYIAFSGYFAVKKLSHTLTKCLFVFFLSFIILGFIVTLGSAIKLL